MPNWKRGVQLALILVIVAAVVTIGFVVIKPTSSTATDPSVLVPVELVLLVDTSSSVDSNEYVMQRNGYANAFRDNDVIQQVETMGGIAVIYIEWDAATHQAIRIPWTHLRTEAECRSYATTIRQISRESQGTTMLAPALEFARNELMTNSFLGMRRVIDVSGDGYCKNWRFYVQGVEDGTSDPAHYGTPWPDVIASLTTSVHALNGVFIGPTGADLDFYEDDLPLGQDAFSLHASNFNEFSTTVQQKIINELSAQIPGTYD
ncbi:MAG: DUF1194 domain-containing protein [Planctomycetes bacterium]|nr:DUF1194 domain-containing protein [Planctomycetota bacterium]